MKLASYERQQFLQYANELITTHPYQLTQNYIQHGKISTYDHCLSVAYYSYWLARRLSLKCNQRALIRGALLHDLFLYDWHEKDDSHKWHGFHHPTKARNNALRYYHINELEELIIMSHMWPLTLRALPKRREAVLVCLIDKVVSTLETIRIDTRVNHKLH